MPKDGERALSHAVRVPVVLRYLGSSGLVLGGATLVPCLGALCLGELGQVPPYASTAAVLLGLGLLARRGSARRGLQRNEALVVAAAAFALGPLVLSVPLACQGLPWIDAVFEAVSGITTTGLSTLDSVHGRPRTFLLARAWMQWVGGLGFVVFSVALMFGPGEPTRRLGESSLEVSDLSGSMRLHARRVVVVYLILTAVASTALLLLGATLLDAVVHTFSGISTGGFASRDTSIAALGRGLQFGIIGISVLGAVSLPLYWRFWRERGASLRRDPQLRVLLCLIAVGALLLWGATRLGASERPSPPDLLLLSASAQSTAGFSTLEVRSLPDGAKAVLILSMISGGSQGATAGGIKIIRLLIVLRLLQWLIAMTRVPASAVLAPSLSGERLHPDRILRAAAVILLFLLVIVVAWLPFLACGYAALDALFEVASATGTVGLSTGISRAGLEPGLKAVLCLSMLLGRLEVFAVLVALSPRTWIGRRVS